MPALTDQQKRFVDELVSTGCTPTEAARRAGYSDPGQEAWRLMRKAHVVSEVRELRERLISGHAANVAVSTLMEIMQDGAAPASARVSAARTVLEAAGHFDKAGRNAGDNQALHEMSAEKLAALIAEIDAQLGKQGGPLH